jgi:glutamine amidotransferase
MIAIIDYDINVSSLVNILKETNYKFKVTSNEFEILKADKIILPDAEDTASAIKQLHKCNLFTMLRVCKKPVLGIGLGMQIMTDKLKEGNKSGLGVFHIHTEEFEGSFSNVPFNGMNEVEIIKESKLFKRFNQKENFCFNNRFYVPINENTSSTANNGIAFSSSLEGVNFYGVQFLPEKSGEAGIKLLRNFIEI